MATPHVTGVVALACALYPNATAAEIRDAVLDGVETSAALAGKTLTGGTLNAYNTLQLLAEQVQQPLVSSLSASPGSVMVGDTVSLTAYGVSDGTGAVTQVLFYLDANGNSQLDAADTLVGSTSTINNGTASVSVYTSGYSVGTHRFLAVAVDDQLLTSAPAVATLTVLPVDDHGDNAGAATVISVPDSVAATLGVAGDEDWFAFEAGRGKILCFFRGIEFACGLRSVPVRRERLAACL